MLVYFDTCAIQRPLDDPAQIRVRLEADAVVGAEREGKSLNQFVVERLHQAS